MFLLIWFGNHDHGILELASYEAVSKEVIMAQTAT
jgi:hypothetical protein